jgi:hypothetical protein
MFGNTIGGALDLDNLADRVIKPVLKVNGLEWKGWHAYRRGLATKPDDDRYRNVRGPGEARHDREEVSRIARSLHKFPRPSPKSGERVSRRTGSTGNGDRVRDNAYLQSKIDGLPCVHGHRCRADHQKAQQAAALRESFTTVGFVKYERSPPSPTAATGTPAGCRF